jgi:hypothetical protein
MIKVVKILRELEERISALENQLSKLNQEHSVEKGQDGSKLSYEEVVDQWLNGKASN